LVLASCQEEVKYPKTKWNKNPNGDSELALLMRDMFDDGLRLKQDIQNGKLPKVMEKFKNIHTAIPTEDGKTDTDIYKAFAESYLNALENLTEADESNAVKKYNFMVDNCMNCHNAICPGPTVRIKQLYIQD
jgi:muramidase (phage lysozyme)